MIAKFAEQKRLEKACEDVSEWLVPQIYACFLTVLAEGGLNQEQLVDVVERTQALWHDSIDDIDDMIAKCEKLTGIDLHMLPKQKRY